MIDPRGREPNEAASAADVPYLRAIPRPTPWPIVTAFGCTLLFAGIVTHIFVSVVGGACAIIGLIGWFRDVFPHEAVEEIPVVGCEVPLPPPEFAAQTAGLRETRRVVPEAIHPYRSGVLGGIVGAVAMAIVACAWGLINERSIWMPINLLAGILVPSVGDASIEQLKSFNGAWFAAAAVSHAVLSVLVGLVFVVALPMMPRRPLLAGGLIAPVLWTGIAWATLRVVNPTLEQYISWPWFLASQFAFGFSCGAIIARFNLVRLQVGQSIAQRLDLDSSGDSNGGAS